MKGKLKQRKTIYTDSPSTLASDDIARCREPVCVHHVAGMGGGCDL